MEESRRRQRRRRWWWRRREQKETRIKKRVAVPVSQYRGKIDKDRETSTGGAASCTPWGWMHSPLHVGRSWLWIEDREISAKSALSIRIHSTRFTEFAPWCSSRSVKLSLKFIRREKIYWRESIDIFRTQCRDLFSEKLILLNTLLHVTLSWNWLSRNSVHDLWIETLVS